MIQKKKENPQQLYVAISETIPKHIPGTVIPNDGQGRPLHVLRIQSKPARLENCDVPSGELREKRGEGVEFLSRGIPAGSNHGDTDSRDEFAWALDFPPFLNLRSNLGRETCLRAVYSDAYRFFLRGLSPTTPHILSDYRQAWDLGITGKPFVLPPRPRLLTGDTADDPPSSPYVIPQRRHIERNPPTETLSPAESRGKSTLF